jgi:hypothetical protein
MHGKKGARNGSLCPGNEHCAIKVHPLSNARHTEDASIALGQRQQSEVAAFPVQHSLQLRVRVNLGMGPDA